MIISYLINFLSIFFTKIIQFTSCTCVSFHNVLMFKCFMFKIINSYINFLFKKNYNVIYHSLNVILNCFICKNNNVNTFLIHIIHNIVNVYYTVMYHIIYIYRYYTASHISLGHQSYIQSYSQSSFIYIFISSRSLSVCVQYTISLYSVCLSLWTLDSGLMPMHSFFSALTRNFWWMTFNFTALQNFKLMMPKISNLMTKLKSWVIF